jgi:2-dehydropantoate 2-reductase
MRALSYPIVDLPGVPVRALAWAFRRLPAAVARPLLRRFAGGGRGGKMPSLHVALHGGRPQTEVGWLNGAVVRHGQALGVATPANQVLTETLEALTAGGLDREAFRGSPEALVSRLEKDEG